MAGTHIMRTVLLPVTHVMKVTKVIQQGWLCWPHSSLSSVISVGQHLEPWLSASAPLCLALHLLVFCLPCITAHTGNQAEPWFGGLDPKCCWPALASVSDPEQIYAPHPFHTTGPGRRSVTVLHPWLFINTKRSNFLCSDYKLPQVTFLTFCSVMHIPLYT